MKSIFLIFLILHIAGGSLGLVSGSINLLMKKGDRNHRIIGKLFVYGMLAAGISALVMAMLHPNSFLFMIGIFTLYMVGTGRRYIRFRLSGINQKPTWVDWSLTIGMLLSGISLIGLGFFWVSKASYFGWVYITFGLFGLFFVKEDLDNYQGKSRYTNYWLLAHVSRMTGGYIASLTAFLVVNAHYIPFALPPVFLWLFPSLILVPFIIRWIRRLGIKKQLT